MGVKRRSILIDEPSREDHFNGKGHERTAVALSKAIAKFYGNDRAIGLDGPWGSGKSTVVEIARKILDERKTQENRAYHFFTFDIWQSQGSSFRRSLLEHFLEWTIVTFPKHRPQLQEVEQKVKGKVREVRSNNQSILDWWGVLVIAALPFLPLYYFWAKSEFDRATDRAPFYSSYSFSLLLLFVAGTFSWALWKMVCDWRKSGGNLWRDALRKYRTALSQTLLIGSKQFEDQRVTQYIREIDPNDFEFQTTLREILSIVQSDKDRVVIVLDNIDRLPKKELNDYWAQVRAVFSGNPAVRQTDQAQSVTVIVPYHRHLVEEQKAENSEIRGPAALSPLGAREIFTKTFDEILQVSPPVMSNSREFFIKKMGEALPDVSDRDELFRVFLIFDRIIRNQNGSATPRQIIGFINELAGMYVLHEGRFNLPTVAVYIAYQDALEGNPGLLNDPSSIEPRVRQVADDNDLEQNLSAMIFNVEPELALQLMLDQRIKDAAVHSPERLIEISNSAGFDVRVDQVVQENAEEWDESGELSSVVSNFAALSKVYMGDAKPHFRKSMVTSVTRMRRFSLEPQYYQNLLAITELVEPDHLLTLVRSLVVASHGAQSSTPNLQIEDGVRWVSFLGSLHRKLTAEGSGNILPSALGTITISGDPRFLFGLAARAAKEGISLIWLRQAKIDFDGQNQLYPNYAVERPADMRAALLGMTSLKLIDDSLKIAIFSALVEQFEAPEVGDVARFKQQVELATEMYALIPYDMRASLKAEKMFATSPFFDHLAKAMESPSDPVLGSALFLAMQSPGQMSLATPSKQARNGVLVSGESDAFALFSKALTTGEGVSAEQFDRLAELHKEAAVFTNLINAGAAQADNQLTNEVIRRGLAYGDLPRMSLPVLNSRYEFLRTLLGDAKGDVLVRFDERIDDGDISDIGLSDCSVALIHDVRNIESSNWAKVRDHVARQLQAVTATDWPQHISDDDAYFEILVEMIEGSSFRVSDPALRDVIVQLVLDVLAGRWTPSGTARLDLLFKAIDPSFHGDMYRQIREGTKDVSPTTLAVAVQHFPETISHVIRSWEHLRKDEKDVLIRFYLCAALEGSIDAVLTDIEALGHTKVKDMVASSQDSTREKLQGAMTVFSEPFSTRDRARRLGELFYGKRKVKGFLDMWFGSSED